MNDFRWLAALLVALPLGGIALILAGRAWGAFRRASAARRWPVAPGQVLHSERVEEMVNIRRNIGIMQSRLARRYRPRVVYQYVVDGRLYTGERIGLNEVVYTSEAGPAERAAQRWRVGSPARVYYDPDDPARAVLDPRPGLSAWIWTAAALGLLGVALFLGLALMGA